MRKLLILGSLGLLVKFGFASGNSDPTFVSTGTARGIDSYLNDDNAYRQAIVIGDFSSSTTLRVDPARGLAVYLGTTSASNIGTATVSGSTVGVVNGGATFNATVVSTGLPVIPNTIPFLVTSSNTNVLASTVGVVNGGSTFSVSAAQSGVWSITATTVGVVNGGSTFNTTINSALPAGTNAIGTVVQSTGGVSASTVAITNAVGTQLTVVSTGIPITTSSALTVVSTGIPIIPSIIGQPVTSTYTTVVSTGLPIIPNSIPFLVVSTNVNVLASTMGVVGSVASGGANTGNPIKIGVVASSNVIAGVNDTQITNVLGTRMGNILATLDCPRENIVKSSNTITASTAETVILSSGAASVYNDLLEMIALNTSATATRVDFRSSGTSTTVEFELYIPAGETRGFTAPHPWPQSTAAAQWSAQSSASVTDVRLYGIYCKEK